MILKLREKLVGAHVHVDVFIGKHPDQTFANAGRLVFSVQEWPHLAALLTNGSPRIVVRGECPGCGHEAHTGEECLAAWWVAGVADGFCDCGRLGQAEPAAEDVPSRPAPRVIVCTTDTRVCTCGAPADTPSGMHHDYCPTNPASRVARSDA